jgi:hypothetical protein
VLRSGLRVKLNEKLSNAWLVAGNELFHSYKYIDGDAMWDQIACIMLAKA